MKGHATRRLQLVVDDWVPNPACSTQRNHTPCHTQSESHTFVLDAAAGLSRPASPPSAPLSSEHGKCKAVEARFWPRRLVKRSDWVAGGSVEGHATRRLHWVVDDWVSLSQQPLRRNVKWLRGGFVFKAHRLLCHSTLDTRVLIRRRMGQPLLPLRRCRANMASIR